MRNNEFKTESGKTLDASTYQGDEDIGNLNKGDYIELYEDDDEVECMVVKKTLKIDGFFKFIVRIVGSAMIVILLFNLSKSLYN